MEWYAEISVRFGGELDPSSENYTVSVERFYGRLSEYLGGEEFEPSMLCRAWGLETFAYVEAGSRTEAAALALRPFRETAEAAWGPGTIAEVLRVVTSEERDQELDQEDAREAARVLADEGDDEVPFRRSDDGCEVISEDPL